MNKNTPLKIGVIGSGVIGTLTAYTLKKKNYSVSLFDENLPGTQTSMGNAGTFAHYACIPINSEDIFKKLPFLLFSDSSPLSIQWKNLFSIYPWLIKFLQNKWRNLQYYSSKEVPNLTYSIGGQISVDIFPEGWDKTYCLQFIKEKYDRILFFGDKTSEGGNDYEIYEHELTESYTVTSPEDTIQKLQSLFNI